MADLASIIQDMREYGTAGPDAYLGPNHMALCLKQQANIWADQLAALSHAAGQEVVAYRWMRNGEPVSEWRNRKPSEREVECARELIGYADWQPQFSYLAPAPPSTSADSLLRRTVSALRYVYDETCTAGVLRADIERYLAASSEGG